MIWIPLSPEPRRNMGLEERMKAIQKKSRPASEDGAILVVSLVLLVLLSVVGLAATETATIETMIAGNIKAQKIAFYDAEAGVNWALARLEADLADGEDLSSIDPSADTDYDAPAGFSFVIERDEFTGTGPYTFTSTGAGPNNAAAVIKITFERESALNYGVFGDEEIEIKNSANIYSYNHNTTPDPTPSDSTGEADIGSNHELEIKSDAFIDGDAALGDDGAGTEATIEIKTGATITGDSGVDVDRIDPDPLGVVGGEYATKFTTYSSSNDNNLASSPDDDLSDNEIYLDGGESMTLNGQSGGANYYLEEINLKNNATLSIDASAGPVNVFLTGKLEAKSGSNINISGAPSDFSIYSNSTDNVEFKNSSAFKGFIYAPYAEVEMKNSSKVYGAIWGKEVETKSSANIYFDTSLKDKIPSNDLSLVAWRDV